MKKNLGPTDRTVRVMLAIVVVVLYATNMISGTLAIILLAISAIFILTSLVSFCPIYAILGLSSERKKGHASH